MLLDVVGGGLVRGTAWLAGATPSPGATPRYEDDAVVRPGWLGLVVFLALLVAAYLLFRSMQHQLKKVDFVEEPPEDGGSAPGDGPTTGSS